MAWNEPGNSGDKDKDPWGKQRGEQGPPDLDEIVKNLQNKVTSIFGKRGGGGGGAGRGRGVQGGLGGVVSIVLIIIAIWLLYSSVYILNERQNGVVLRFGEYVTTIQPGLNVRFPYPIETVEIIDVQALRAFSVGQSDDALMLTKDKNIVDIEYVVQYRVGDAKKFALNTRNPLASLENVAHSSVRELIGRNNMEYVQTQGRAEFSIRAKERIQEVLERYDTGLILSSFEMQKAQAPRPVIPAYEEVNAAQQEKEAEINKAEAFANTIIPKAEGEANRLREQAAQYRETIIARASGDAQRFTQLLTQYEKAPKVTRERLYLETMQDIIGRSNKVIIDVDKGNSLLYLPLDQIVPRDVLRRDGNTSGDSKSSGSSFSGEMPSLPDPSRSRSRGSN